MQVYDNYNPQILKQIPGTVTRVLEIGCDTGKLAEAFRAQHAGVEWIGVDINPQSIALAKDRLDVAITADADRPLEHSSIPLSHFDCLIYGDVLEHLKNPWDTLKAHCAFLQPGAWVVACIPNIQHWSVIRTLLTDEWRYTSKGILDKTHLRFFGRESLEELFVSAGLTVENVRPLIFRDNDDRFLENLSRACADSEMPFNREAVMPFQYVVRSRKD